jgi:PKD repeat protein
MIKNPLVFIISCLLLTNALFSDDIIRLTHHSMLDESNGSVQNLREDILLEEGFEGTISGWAYIDNNNDSEVWGIFEDANAAHTGTKGAGIFTNGVVSDDYFIFPSIDLPANQSIQLSFWSRSMSDSYPESFNIRVSTSGDAASDYILIESFTNVPESWTQYLVDLTTYSGQTVSLAIHNISNSMYYQFVDDIQVTADDIGSTPTANFSATPTSGEAPLVVQFTDQSSDSPTSWAWNFGDGTTSSSQHPTHTYSNSGSYSVTLSAANSNGQDSEIKTNYISVSDVQPPIEIPIVEAGLRYSSVANISTINTFGGEDNLTVQGNNCYVAYKRGSGTSVSDRQIKVGVSNDLGQSWVEHDLTVTSSNTNDPIIFSTPTSVVILYQFLDTSNENKVCIARSSDGGLTFSTSINSNENFVNSMGYESYAKMASTDNGKYFLYLMGSLFVSLDDGISFQETASLPEYGIWSLAATNDILWLASYDSNTGNNYIYKSTNNGDSYQLIDQYQSEILSYNSIDLCARGNQLFIGWISEEVSQYFFRGKIITGNNAGPQLEIETVESIIYANVPVNVSWTEEYLWFCAASRFLIRSNDSGNSWSSRVNLTAEMSVSSYGISGSKMLAINDSTQILLINDSVWGESTRQFIFANVKYTDTSILTVRPGVYVWSKKFDWDPYLEPHTSLHRLQISDDNSFTNLFYDEMVGNSSTTYISIDLSDIIEGDGSEYFARVRGEVESPGTFTTDWSPKVSFIYGTVGVTNVDAKPKKYRLEQNYPNPFNPSTTFRYGLPEETSVSLVIYDIRGNTVRTIDSGSQVAGWYEHMWNGMNDEGQPVSTGVYLTRLRAGSYTKTIKMLYLK